MLSPLRSLDNPIRAELFGVERLEQHAEILAAAQPVITRLSRGRRLLALVEDNGRVLRESYRVIANAIREERAIVPAAEWLVDNFHVVDEQLREIRDDLPPGFYRKLPKLAEGPLADDLRAREPEHAAGGCGSQGHAGRLDEAWGPCRR